MAIFPKTQPETTGIVYVFESISSSYMATRSDEFRVPVRPAGQCDNPAAVIYTGANPNIALGSTSGTPLAPGFQASGISSVIGPTGITSAATGGGGVSGRTLALIGGTGGAAAFFAFSGGDGETTIPSDGIGGISTTAGTTTTTVSGGGPTSTTTTATAGGTTTSIPSGGTTTTAGGGGSTTTGGTTSVPTTSVPTTSVPTTSIATTTTVGGAVMRLDSITVSPFGPGIWTFDVDVTNLGPATAPNVLLTFSLPPADRFLGGAPGCVGGLGFGQCSIGSLGSGGSASRAPELQLNGGGSHRITGGGGGGGGTTDPNTGNNQASVTVSTLRTTDGTAPVAAIRSTIDVRPLDGHVRARITVNDTGSEETSNSGPRLHRFTAQSGENLAEAQVELGAEDSGTWRFDFSPTETLVPGSLQVLFGQAIAQNGSSITFRLEGGAIRLRFTFELSEGTR